MGESQGEQEMPLGEKEHGEERVSCTMKEGRFQGGEGGKAKKTFLREIGESVSR